MTTTTNEAAEWLREKLRNGTAAGDYQVATLDDALTLERRATAERIWQRVIPNPAINGEAATALRAILDEALQ